MSVGPVSPAFPIDEASRMPAQDHAPDASARRVRDIREEMKFELGALHDRVNALISTEAFLLISFVASLPSAGDRPSGRYFWIPPLLSLVGFLLAALAWPGVEKGVAIVAEWNLLLIAALREARRDPDFVWRPSVDAAGEARTQRHHRRGMLLTRAVPGVFAAAWLVLAIIALTGPLRHA